MHGIEIVKTGNIIKSIFNEAAERFTHYSINSVTGLFVAKLNGGNGIETNILGESIPTQSDHEHFNTISTVIISDNTILFDELEKLL